MGLRMFIDIRPAATQGIGLVAKRFGLRRIFSANQMHHAAIA